jgi:hypothetical protein
MKTCEEMVENLLKRREQYITEQKKKRKIIIGMTASFCCVLVVSLLGLGLWQRGLIHQNLPQPSQSEDVIVGGFSENNEQIGEDPNQSTDLSLGLEETSKQEFSGISKEPENELETESSFIVEQMDSSKPEEVTSEDIQTNTNYDAVVDIEEVSKETEPVNSKEDTHTNNEDMAYEYPSFTTENQFKNWLLGNNDAFVEERGEALNTLSDGNTVTYYKPVIFNSSLYKLTSISYETGGYRYIFDEVTNNDYHDFLWINVNNETIPQLQEYFEKHKQKWLNHDERYFSATVDGIEYACFHNSSDQTYVSWQQFGKYHTAYVAPGYFERIEEVLPLLKLEAVKLRTDTVTQ